MTLQIAHEMPPIHLDAHGVARVGGTRVTLHSVVEAFRLGATAETIVDKYPALELADVYAALAYYLRHRDEVEDYLAEQERQAAELRVEMQRRFPRDGLRARLAGRRAPATP